jgi:Zn-dependent protease with chaperone function
MLLVIGVGGSHSVLTVSRRRELEADRAGVEAHHRLRSVFRSSFRWISSRSDNVISAYACRRPL